MKRVFMMLFLSFGLLFANDTVLNSILKNVSLPNTNRAISDAQNLQQNLTKENFAKFVASWKKVEDLYFAGELDEDYADTTRYVDVFHNLKEDLNAQIKNVIASNDESKIALFKNSFKTINALEYVMFNDKVISVREEALSKEILNSIISKLQDIKGVYESYIKTPTKDEKWENAMIVNSLIASSYRLKEWRIGDVSGNSSKYKSDAKNERAEYFLSQNSFGAIKSILEAHEEIMGDKNYKNFGTVAKTEANKEVLDIQKAIKNLEIELLKLKNDDFTKASNLYEASKVLHNAYYLSLVEQLQVTAKILDADGD